MNRINYFYHHTTLFMKKIVLFTVFTLLTFFGYSQTISYGVNAGLNITKASMVLNGQPNSNNYEAGFHVGSLVDIKFGSFSIQPGLFFTTKGGATENVSQEVSTGLTTPATGTTKLILDYIEVPVNFLYKLKAGSGELFFGAGPYVAIGVHAVSEFNGKYNGTTDYMVFNEEFGSGNNAKVKRFDLGMNGILGYRLKSGFAISAEYGESVVNISNVGGSVKNQGFSFSLGYFFK
jgi:hypothetical protein